LSGSQTIPKKNLVIFPGALGDFICFLPALEKIARAGGLDLLARTEYGDLLPPTVTTRSVECYEISRLFVPGAERDERLKCFYRSYSSIYSWMGSNQPDFVKHLQILSGNRLWIFPFRPSSSRIPMVDYYLSCLGEGYPREIFPAIPLRSDALSWIQGFWQQSGLQERRILVLAPGSGAAEKNWPIQFYKVVAEWWEKRFGKVIALLGPVEEDRGGIGNHWGHALVLRGLELAKVAALLTQCDLYLGNDSGVTHLAAALGAEALALFGPTDPVQWAPRGKKVTAISQNVECSPCVHSVMKACPHRKCLTTLNPVDVIGKLEEVWERC
jgi:ADP-heptose:LPS heptosyltransferase